MLLFILAVTITASFAIHNGEPAAANQFPFAAQIFRFDVSDYRLRCTGIIVSTTQISCSAHCFRGLDKPSDAKFYHVYVGSEKLKDGIRIQVTNFEVHEAYNPGTNDFDVGIINLSKAIRFEHPKYTSAIIKLSDSDLPNPGENLVFMGWGPLNGHEDSPPSQELIQIELPLIEQTLCEKTYKDFLQNIAGVQSKIKRVPLGGRCVGFIDQGKTGALCNSDSGSPAVYRSADDTELKLYRIYSMGMHPCHAEDIVSIFISVNNPIVRSWWQKKKSKFNSLPLYHNFLLYSFFLCEN